jgi:Gti1/Pac2 family transcription factor
MYVRSGTVFVWEESEDDAGIKRWTDGCMWSQSRMREPFLFYEEKLQDDRVGMVVSHGVTQVQFTLL